MGICQEPGLIWRASPRLADRGSCEELRPPIPSGDAPFWLDWIKAEAIGIHNKSPSRSLGKSWVCGNMTALVIPGIFAPAIHPRPSNRSAAFSSGYSYSRTQHPGHRTDFDPSPWSVSCCNTAICVSELWHTGESRINRDVYALTTLTMIGWMYFVLWASCLAGRLGAG